MAPSGTNLCTSKTLNHRSSSNSRSLMGEARQKHAMLLLGLSFNSVSSASKTEKFKRCLQRSAKALQAICNGVFWHPCRLSAARARRKCAHELKLNVLVTGLPALEGFEPKPVCEILLDSAAIVKCHMFCRWTQVCPQSVLAHTG